MKIFSKLLSALLVLPILVTLTACDDDDNYTPAEKLTSAQVYFPNELPTGTYDLVTEGEGVYYVTLSRLNTNEALEVNLEVLQPEGQDLFKVPASVAFAEGESTVTIEVTYDPSAVEYDKYYLLSLSIADEELQTPYIGHSSYTLTAFIASPWDSLGIGLYTDDFMTFGFYDEDNNYEWTSAFGINDPVTYPVEVLVNSKKPGLYRLKNAYGEANPLNEEGDWDTSKDYYLEIDATNPNYVFITKQELGNNWGYGMFAVESDGAHYMNLWEVTPAEVVEIFAANGYDSPFGKLENDIITFPEDAFEMSFGNYGGYYANHNGAFELVLPDAYAAMQDSEGEENEEEGGEAVRAFHSFRASPARIKFNHTVK